MAKDKPRRDRSKIPQTAAWCALQRPAWDAYRAKRENARERRAEKTANGVRITLPVVPCKFVGESLTMKEVQEAGLNPRRKWHRCEKGLTKNKRGVAGAACSCEGCNSKCEGYEKP